MATKSKLPLTHPSMRPRQRTIKSNLKQRSTTVRVAKLVNVQVSLIVDPETGEETQAERDHLVQVPIEPSFNNKGSLGDSSTPLRHYLDKGFEWPHEHNPEKYPGIYCALKDCWEWAGVTQDPENGTERCAYHETEYLAGRVRYAESAKGN